MKAGNQIISIQDTQCVSRIYRKSVCRFAAETRSRLCEQAGYLYGSILYIS
jgi:hypothetical protein